MWKYGQKKRLGAKVMLLLAVVFLPACQTTQRTGPVDYSQGVAFSVPADATHPAYVIGEDVGAAGTGYAYLLEKTDGRWRMMYDSFDAKVFAKSLDGVREVPEGVEVLWTDGRRVAVYFGSEPLSFSRRDGSFACPKPTQGHLHRACRSLFTEPKGLLDGLIHSSDTRPFVLDFDEIQRAVVDTGIVARARKRIARDQ